MAGEHATCPGIIRSIYIYICLHSHTACHCYGIVVPGAHVWHEGNQVGVEGCQSPGALVDLLDLLGMRSSQKIEHMTVMKCFQLTPNHFGTGWRLGGGG